MSPVAARRLARFGVGVSISFCAGTALVLLHVLAPASPWQPPELDLSPSPRTLPTAEAAVSLDDLAVIWQRDLRQPVIEPPAKMVDKPAEPTLAIRLMGTAIEGRRRYGLFQLSSGATTLKPVGEQIEGFDILAIDRGRAFLRNGGHDCVLTVPWYERIRAAEATDGH